MDAPEAVLISRKAEITPDEITRLRRTYAELSAGFRDSVVVDASRPLEEVAIRVSREILSRLALRFPALYPSAPRSGEVIRQAMSQFAGTECIFAPPEDKRRTIVLHAGERRPAPDLPGLHYGFAALPSRKNPRWLVPLGNTGAALAAMDIYSPYKFPARLFKHCLMTAISSRFPVWERDRVLLDCERPLRLEALVAQITGERRPVFCFSIGKNTRFAKLTVQAMRPGGEILGYFKFPLTAAAVERVRQEREALDRLRRCPALRDQVPAVLYSGEWRDGYILFQSAAHGRPGPARISELQEEFLHVLATVNRIDMNARVLVQKVAARWESASKSLRSDWQQLAERALEIADRRLDGAAVRCGATHGDFAPWNTKVVGRSLFVFDWEAARWDCPVLWDRFHFDVQTASLLGRRLRPFSTYRDRDKRRPLLLLYLLDSVSALVAEGVNEQEVDIRYRKALLASLLKPAAIGI